MLPSNVSAFSALSSVAMDELYALERAEAARRAEYEIRHTEVLRRAEYEARHAEILNIHGRVSKSASTTPLMSPNYVYQPEKDGYFGSREHERPAEPASHRNHARRLSASSSRREYAAGHTVDSRGHAHIHGHSANAQPYPHPSHRPHPHRHAQDDCPSPASSDSDSMHAVPSPIRPTALHAPTAGYAEPSIAHHGSRTPGSEIAFTPSTSPFLGGMRKLNIHSAVPSRAPSPFHLPPPSLDSPVDGSYHQDSPPTVTLGGRKRNSTGDLVSLTQHSNIAGLYQPYPYSHDRSVAYLPTPQLSSGPSSSGSSPRSHANASLGGSLSTSSSRAPSPPLWSKAAHHSHPRDRDQPHHHHLAHSVRVAFGMTPIHPRSRPSAAQQHPARPFSDIPTASTFSLGEHASAGDPTSASVPGSRSSSPPIRLPPLKLPPTPSSPPPRRSVPVGVKGLLNEDPAPREVHTHAPERVELPRFREVEAATGLR